jgi:putative SOS response-associated peptidase YedK
MCGRFNLTKPQEIQARFGFLDWHERRIEPRFNIAPSQEILTIVREPGAPSQTVMARWGLEPLWLTRSAQRRPPPINARAESILGSRMFRDCRRCLIPATGFYEWQAGTPMHICRQDGGMFALGGLWLPGVRGEAPSAAILTTRPNTLLLPIHDRMPAIMRAEDEQAWLDPALPLERAVELLQPYPAEEMQAYAVGPLVNAWSNDSPEVLLHQPATLPLF